MKKLFIILFMAVLVPVLWIVACSDNPDSSVADISGPRLSGEKNVLIFKKLDFGKAGDPFSTPDNFIEVTPVEWDGVSEFKPDIIYKMSPEVFARTASLGKEHEEFYNYFMQIDANGVDPGKKKNEDTSLASVSGSANCIGNGYVYGEASANGGGTIIARAVVRLDEYIYANFSQPGGAAHMMAACLSGCFSCTVAANDGHQLWSETCSR